MAITFFMQITLTNSASGFFIIQTCLLKQQHASNFETGKKYSVFSAVHALSVCHDMAVISELNSYPKFERHYSMHR